MIGEIVVEDGGWWPPGKGEPGTDWEFEPRRLRLLWDDSDAKIDVLLDDGTALCSLSIAGIARCLAARDA